MTKNNGFVSPGDSEQFLSTLVAESTDGIMVIDSQGMIRFANPAAKDLFKTMVDELVGYHFGTPAINENVEIVIPQDHQQRTIEMRATDITWQGETAQLALLRDITERVRIEEELRERERLLRETNKMARVGGWALDIETSEVWWSEVTREIHEVPDDFEPQLDEALDFFPPPGQEQLANAIAHTRETGEPYDMELPFVTYEGNRLWTRTIGEAEFRDGEVVELRGTFQDITERKKAEQELRKSERQFRLLFEHDVHGFALNEVVTDESGEPSDFIFLEVNRAYEEFLGVGRKELIGKPALKVLPELRGTRAIEALKEVYKTGEPQSFEYYFEAFDSYFMISAYQPLPGQVATIFNDITDRKRAEEELRRSERQFRQLFEHDINGFALVEVVTEQAGDIQNLVFKEVNQAFEEILGLNREAVLGEPAEEISAVFRDTELRGIVGKVFLTGEPERFDYYSENYEKYFNLSIYQPLPNQVAVIFNDITERKKAEEQLRQSEEKYRTLYQTMTLGALNVTQDLQIHTVNLAAEEILGLGAEEITNWKYTDPPWKPINLDGEPLPDEERPSVKALREGKKVENFVYAVYNPEKEKHVWLNVSAVPQFREGEEEPYQVFTTFLDITDRIEAERGLRQSEEKFRKLYESMAQGVVYVDREGNYTSGNPAAEEILGLSIEKMKDHSCTDPVWDIIQQNGKPLPEEQHPIIAALRTGERVEDVVYGVKNPETNERVWLKVSAVPQFREGEEEPYQVFTTFLDITDLVETERELRTSEKKFRTLYETMAQGVVIQNKEGKITSANPAAARILGLNRERLAGMSSLDKHWQTVRMNGEPLPGEEHPAMIALREGRRVEDFNMGLYGGRDEANRWLSVSAVPQFREGEEEPYQVFTTFLDITDRIRVQHVLEERVKELRCLSNISAAIQEDPSIPEICERTVAALVPAMQYPEIAKAVVEIEGHHYEQDGFSDGAENSLVVPIQLHGEQIGKIRVCYVEDREFVLPEEKNLLESVGERLASYYDRLQTQQALEDSEERFRTAVMAAPNPVAIYAEDGEILTLNNAWTAFSGYEPEDIPTIPAWLEKAYGEQAPAVQAMVDRLFVMQEAVDESEQRIRTKDGGERVWYYRSAPLGQMPDGRKAVITMATDITERVEAQEELEASEERFRTAFYNAPYPIMIHAEDGQVLTINNAWIEGSGYSAEELQTLEDWTKKAFRDRGAEVLAMIREKYASKAPLDEEEMTILTRDGTQRIWQFTTAPLGTSQDGRLTAITIAKDITERERYLGRIMALQEIDRVISATLDLDEVLHLIIGETQHLVYYDSMSVMLRVEDRLEIFAVQGLEETEGLEEVSVPIDPDYPNYKVIMEKRPLALANVVEEHPKFFKPLRPEAVQPIKSWLGVPLISQDEVIGIFSIDRHEVNEFSEEDIEITQQLANRAAIAISNARLYEKTRRQLEQLEILRKIDSLITRGLALDEALPELLNFIRDGLGVDAAAVFLLDEESESLKLEAWRGLRETPETEMSIALGQGYTGVIAQTKESLFIPEVSYGEFDVDFPIIWDTEEIASFYGLPMLSKGKLNGVLELFHRSRLDPDEDWVNFAETLSEHAAITVDNITLFNNLQKANEELQNAYDKTIEGWSRALELRDQETEGHSQRVVNLSLRLAREFGFEEEDLPHIRRGVYLHDIGKMGIPDAILHKPGPLTDEEWEIMRQHPKFACNMLKDIEYLEPALKIPHYHHERWDGSGYPEGLEGKEIPLEARIFMVVDIWDALTSDRPYRDAWSEEKTIEYLQEQAGKELDPEIVKVFLEIIQKDRE